MGTRNTIAQTVTQMLSADTIAGDEVAGDEITYKARIKRLFKTRRIENEYDLRWQTNFHMYSTIASRNLGLDLKHWQVKNEVQISVGENEGVFRNRKYINQKYCRPDIVLHNLGHLVVAVELKVFRSDVSISDVESDLKKLKFYVEERNCLSAIYIYLRPASCVDNYLQPGARLTAQQRNLLTTNNLTIIPIAVCKTAMGGLDEQWAFQRART